MLAKMLAVKTVLMMFNIYAMKYANYASSNMTNFEFQGLEKVRGTSLKNGTKNNNLSLQDHKEGGDYFNDTANVAELLEAKEAARKRTVVKLNMKQTLIMNQAIALYALTDSSDHICRNHSREFQDGLRAFEPWALQMFDSSSKLQAGILAGNLMDFGSFKQCVRVFFKSQYGHISGKHCVLRIRPSEKILKKMLSYRNVTERRYNHVRSSIDGASLLWSVCIPDSCSSGDALKHFNKSLMGVFEGLNVNISLSDIDCYSKKRDETPLSKNETFVVYGFLGYFLVVILCTITEVFYKSRKVRPSKFIEIFSIYSNVAYITSYKEETANLDCLHGIRFISICYVVFGHKYLMTLFFPSINALDILNWFTEYPSTIILGGTVSVDSFFVISGLLVSYHFFNHMSNGGKFNYGLFCIHRYIRLTPSYGAVILFLITLAHRLGSGPLWKKVCRSVQKPCEYFWWSALLYIQPYVNPRYTCILQTWYLSCEVQYYLFSPLIMYPLWRWRIFGIVNIALLYVCSVCVNFYFAWKYEYTAGMLMDSHLPTSDYFAYHYIMPYVRASPYILGIGFGYVLQKTKDLKVRMGNVVLLLGWLSCFSLLATVILTYNHFELEEYDYNRLEQSFFISMHRSAWVLGLMWIIWVCRSGYGGPINTFLSAQIFQIFGRITYSIFLVHMLLQFMSLGSLKLPIYFSNFDCIHRAFGDVCLSLILGFLLTILVEYPCVRISLHLFKAWRQKVVPE